MLIPFYFGKILTNENFTDREDDLKRLKNNFTALTNTIIVSPRRWGKSSLVQKALAELPGGDYITVSYDAFLSRDWESFLANYAVAINRASGADGNLSRLIASLLPSLRPSFKVEAGNVSVGMEVSLDLKRHPMSVDEILDLPQKIAEKKKKKVIVCIDEFQNIADYRDSLSVQKILRSHWQTHPDVAYCLFGSKFNVMSRLIAKPKMPFYKFGDMFYLQKIAEDKWVRFICGRFSETGRIIGPEAAADIARRCENHPYYVQQLAQMSWFRTPQGGECDGDTVRDAFEALVDQLSMQFLQTVSELTATQTGFIRALCDGMSTLTSVDVLRDYRLGTAPNVTNIRKALEKKEIITTFPDRTELQDPIFKYWFVNWDRIR